MRFLSTAGSTAVLALVSSALAACSDSTAPRPSATRPVVATSVADPATFLVANSVKYRDAGQHPATGRSGSATLTVRALRAKDNTTQFEITTGTLDDGSTAPGQLAKVQLKGLDPNDASVALWTDNKNGLTGGGYATYTYPVPGRGLPVQVQANIRGIDPRTDVVTVVEHVKLRPDLSPTALVAPSGGRINTPITIGATVRELNGDVGARANCVLYVDDAEADRLNGMWVDAGGTVSCAFAHTFTTTGTKALRVALESVVPGDWDTANNSVSGSIAITSGNDFNYQAYAFSDVEPLTYHVRWDYDVTTPWYRNVYGGEYNDSESAQQATLYGDMPVEIPFPLTSVQLSMTSGGSTWHSASLTDVAPSERSESTDGSFRYACTFNYTDTPAGRFWFNLCSSRQVDTWSGSGTVYSSTSFVYQHWAGAAVYWSSSYQHVYYPDGTGYSYSTEPTYGSLTYALAPVGSDFQFSVDIAAGGATYHTAPTVPLQEYVDAYSNPYSCWDSDYTDWDGTRYLEHNCSESSFHRRYVSGFRYGVIGEE